MGFASTYLPIKCCECGEKYKISDKVFHKQIVQMKLRYICNDCKSEFETNFI